MRLLLGIILGFLITVGGVYVRDSTLPATTVATPIADRPMVNWEVVNNRVNGLTAWIGDQWNALTSGSRRPPETVPPARREPLPDPSPAPEVIPAPPATSPSPGPTR